MLARAGVDAALGRRLAALLEGVQRPPYEKVWFGSYTCALVMSSQQSTGRSGLPA